MMRLIGAALTMVLLLFSPVEAAVQVFIDNNSNGVFDAGDVDATEQLKTTGVLVTTESIVVPAGAYLRLTLDSASLRAGKQVRLDGQVSSTGMVFVSTESGVIDVGPRALIVASTLQLTAGGDLVVDRSRMRVYKELMLESLNGTVSISNSVLTGGTRAEINGYSAGGGLVMTGSTLQATQGLVNIHLEGPAQITNSRLYGQDVSVTARGGWAEVLTSALRVGREGAIMVLVEASEGSQNVQLGAQGATLNVRGTRFYGSPDNILLIADYIDGF